MNHQKHLQCTHGDTGGLVRMLMRDKNLFQLHQLPQHLTDRILIKMMTSIAAEAFAAVIII
jgi:hypothetical protein